MPPTESLQCRREELDLSPTEMAVVAGCDIEIIVRTEMGLCVPFDTDLGSRLARAYGVPWPQFVSLALKSQRRAARYRTAAAWSPPREGQVRR